MSSKIVVILGPTASGKTALSIKLAKKFDGEIVCADSRQIYKDMQIGTASPFDSLRSDPHKFYGGQTSLFLGVAHHLFHIISPKKIFSVAQYQKLALKTIKNIQKQGKIPFLVGGTAFYIYSVVEGWQFPKSKANPELRKKLGAQSPAQLFAILKKLDKTRAKNIDKNNKRRLIRAIEMAKELGEVPSIIKKPQFDCLVLGIKPNKAKLQKRISQRVEKMFKQGLEKEVKALVKKYGWTPVLKNTIGYAEWQNHLNLTKSSSEPDLVKFRDKTKEELIALISLHTRQFAKRQMTWFKRDPRIHWVSTYGNARKLVSNFL